MSDNLYAPPQADLGEPALSSEGTGDFSFGRALSDAWANTWANFPLWLGVGVVGLIAAGAATLTVIGIFLIVPVLGWGALLFFLKMHDGGAQFGDLFAGFSRYGQALAGMLGFWLVSFLVGLVGQGPLTAVQAGGGGAAAIIGAYVVYLAVTLLVTPRISMAALLIVDRGIGVAEAVGLAWDRTGPVMWKLAGLMLLSVLIALVGLAALVVGAIPATVIIYLMFVSAYRQIFGGALASAA